MSCQHMKGMHVVVPLPKAEPLPEHGDCVCPTCGSAGVTIRGDICECRCGYRWRWPLAMELA